MQTRLLTVAVVQAFAPRWETELAEAGLLNDGGRWAADEHLMLLCNDLLALALYQDDESSEEDDDAEWQSSGVLASGSTGWEDELAAFSRVSAPWHAASPGDDRGAAQPSRAAT